MSVNTNNNSRHDEEEGLDKETIAEPADTNFVEFTPNFIAPTDDLDPETWHKLEQREAFEKLVQNWDKLNRSFRHHLGIDTQKYDNLHAQNELLPYWNELFNKEIPTMLHMIGITESKLVSLIKHELAGTGTALRTETAIRARGGKLLDDDLVKRRLENVRNFILDIPTFRNLPIDLINHLHYPIEIIRLEAYRQQDEINFSVLYSQELNGGETFTMLANPTAFYLMLRELARNSMKATAVHPKDEPAIVVMKIAFMSDKSLKIICTDNGEGHYPGKTGWRGNVHSSGIGLNAFKQLGWDVTLESPGENMGSTVSITLPPNEIQIVEASNFGANWE